MCDLQQHLKGAQRVYVTALRGSAYRSSSSRGQSAKQPSVHACSRNGGKCEHPADRVLAVSPRCFFAFLEPSPLFSIHSTSEWGNDQCRLSAASFSSLFRWCPCSLSAVRALPRMRGPLLGQTAVFVTLLGLSTSLTGKDTHGGFMELRGPLGLYAPCWKLLILVRVVAFHRRLSVALL